MCDGIEEEAQNLHWLMAGLVSGIIVCVTDELYDQKSAPTIRGVGILLCCIKAKRMLRGNF